ncbi:hypothetical protein IJG91_03145 [Candidatus Saccharibacteria bacterium]|nr:hypothetical protein [Candidatus Saccharibacteria bacterium]
MFEDFDNIPGSEIPQSRAVLRNILKSRGWKNIKILFTNKLFVVATRPDGREVRFCSEIPPTTNYNAAAISDDKYATYAFLKNFPKVKQPETMLLKNQKQELKICEDLIKKYSRIVLKPVNGSHGNDVHMNITDIESTKNAITKIRNKDKNLPIIAQQQLDSKCDTRVICINYQFVAAYSRTPAEVTGDGKHTVSELIDIENKTIRTTAYFSDLSKINKTAALEYLKQQKDYIPKSGEKVQVVPVCNTGQGGTIKEITNEFPDNLKRLSEEIAKYLELPLVGIDFLDNQVLEVNKSPALYHKKDGHAICLEKLVEYLETIV